MTINRFGMKDATKLHLTVRPVSRLSAEEVADLMPLTIEGDSAMRRVLEGRMAGSIAVIARCRDEAVGWSVITPLSSAFTDDKVRSLSSDRIFIISVFVRPDCRQGGIGRKLGQLALNEAKKVRSDAIVIAGARLVGGTEEEAGLKLYQSLGLVEGDIVGKESYRAREFYKKWR